MTDKVHFLMKKYVMKGKKSYGVEKEGWTNE